MNIVKILKASGYSFSFEDTHLLTSLDGLPVIELEKIFSILSQPQIESPHPSPDKSDQQITP